MLDRHEVAGSNPVGPTKQQEFGAYSIQEAQSGLLCISFNLYRRLLAVFPALSIEACEDGYAQTPTQTAIAFLLKSAFTTSQKLRRIKSEVGLSFHTLCFCQKLFTLKSGRND
jgi:hypothetical protein